MNPPRRLLEDGTLDPGLKADLALMAQDPVTSADVGRAAAVFTAALAAGAFGAQGAAAAATAAAATSAAGSAVGWTAKLGAAKGWLLFAGLTAASGGVVGGLAVTHQFDREAHTARRPARAIPHVAPARRVSVAPPMPIALPPVEVAADVPEEAPRRPRAVVRPARSVARQPVAARPRTRTVVAAAPAPVEPAEKPAPVEAPTPAVAAPVPLSELAAESAQLGAIRRTIDSDPAHALSLIESGDARYPRGKFTVEREALAVVALHRLGRRDEAREAGRLYLKRNPTGPGNERVRCIVEARSESCKSP